MTEALSKLFMTIPNIYTWKETMLIKIRRKTSCAFFSIPRATQTFTLSPALSLTTATTCSHLWLDRLGIKSMLWLSLKCWLICGLYHKCNSSESIKMRILDSSLSCVNVQPYFISISALHPQPRGNTAWFEPPRSSHPQKGGQMQLFTSRVAFIGSEMRTTPKITNSLGHPGLSYNKQRNQKCLIPYILTRNMRKRSTKRASHSYVATQTNVG